MPSSPSSTICWHYIPEPLEPLDAVMLDGFLCGVLVQPELVGDDVWLPFVFDAGGHRWGEAEPSPEQLRARSLILRRHAALNRSIAEFGGFDPFVLELLRPRRVTTPRPRRPSPTPSRRRRSIRSARRCCPGSRASSRRCTCCRAWPTSTSPTVTTTLARLFRFLPEGEDDPHGIFAVVERERPLGSLDEAIGEVVACVADLYELTAPLRYKVEAVRRDAPKVGRNEPCPCGSGKKFKQCHGGAGAAKA